FKHLFHRTSPFWHDFAEQSVLPAPIKPDIKESSSNFQIFHRHRRNFSSSRSKFRIGVSVCRAIVLPLPLPKGEDGGEGFFLIRCPSRTDGMQPFDSSP